MGGQQQARIAGRRPVALCTRAVDSCIDAPAVVRSAARPKLCVTNTVPPFPCTLCHFFPCPSLCRLCNTKQIFCAVALLGIGADTPQQVDPAPRPQGQLAGPVTAAGSWPHGRGVPRRPLACPAEQCERFKIVLIEPPVRLEMCMSVSMHPSPFRPAEHLFPSHHHHACTLHPSHGQTQVRVPMRPLPA